MIKITDKTRLDKEGETVDDSIYIDRYDSRNMILVKYGAINKKTGKPNRNILGYYSNINTLLKHSIDFIIKDGSEVVEIATMRDTINRIESKIDEICKDMPTMFKLMENK